MSCIASAQSVNCRHALELLTTITAEKYQAMSDELPDGELEHDGLLDSLGVTTVDASKVEQSVLARVSTPSAENKMESLLHMQCCAQCC